jgi:seryl-tRNA synthetase
MKLKRLIGMADNLAKRKMKVDFQKITELYHHANALQFELNQMRSQHNRNSQNLIADKQLKASITEKTGILNELNMTLSAQAKLLPNEIHISVPITEQLVFQSNETPVYDFIPKTHLDLATHHNMLDIARAGKVSGSGFYYLKGAGALLEMALTRYAMDICIKHGFEPIITPDIIRTSILDGCGFSPRSNDPHTYFLKSADPSCLAATAEFPLAVFYFQVGHVFERSTWRKNTSQKNGWGWACFSSRGRGRRSQSWTIQSPSIHKS